MRHHLQIACRLTILALLLCAGLSIARAQAITGELKGTVKDTTGATVAGATVTITNSDTKLVARTVTTDDAGGYSAPLLPVAYYDITVEAASFKKHIDERVKVSVNERRTANVTLEAGEKEQEGSGTIHARAGETPAARGTNV